ncbi:MAG TPA: glycosyltransferase family A protein [Gaiellaceae bacterium]|nr:glycosyltransferase family A protein [Gaiellaceae bacterium]
MTPARDEAAELPRLAACLAAQTVPPATWVVVENGSADGTAAVARALAAEHDWIVLAAAPPGPPRLRGAPVVRALHAGFAALAGGIEIVAKVDADVSLPADYFERLLRAFAAEPALGLASGDCIELVAGSWRERPVTGTHVWGAARAYRRACLEQLLPLDERMGWDGIDQLRAATRGWKVERVADLRFRHHRREGARDGSRRRAWAAQGGAAHYMGYRVSYLLLRTLHRARREPAALAILPAYLAAALRREPRCPDAEVTRRLREQQRARHLLRRAREATARAAPRSRSA